MLVRATPLRRRISRGIVTILALSSLAVVVPPVLAPQFSTSQAAAADANPFPTIAGMVRYLAESFTVGSSTWPSTAGTNPVAITGTALTRETTTAGTFGASKAVPAVRGLSTTTLTWPAAILNTSAYTFITVARYAPSNSTYSANPSCTTTDIHTVNNVDKRNRIFSNAIAGDNNWLHGFWACASGVNHRNGWYTPFASAITEMSGNKIDNWLLGAECGYVLGGSADCNGQYRAFGSNRTLSSTPTNYNRGYQVVINGGQFPQEVSDFQIAEVIAYPTILTLANVIKIETYLARQYGLTLSASTATKLAVYTPSVGSSLGQAFTTQPQIVVQDTNGQTVTTNNTTTITATITGAGGALIGTQTADVVQGIATFENLGVTGTSGTSYTITYSAAPALTTTSEVRTYTRSSRTATLSLSKSQLAMGETAVATISTLPSSNNDGAISFTATGNACSVASATGVVTATRPDGTCSISATIAAGSSYDAASTSVSQINISTLGSEVDSALSLNGTSQYAIAQDAPVFDLGASFTIQGWIYPTSVSGTRVILSKENSYRVSIVDGKFVVSFSTNATTPNWTFTPTSIPAVANEWHHFAITRASGSTAMIFYLDGVSTIFANNIPADTDADALSGTITPANSSLPFTIGASTTNGSSFANYFAGEIDNIAAVNAVRTPAQILADSREYISPTTTSLAYYYDFNEGANSTLFNRVSASPVSGDLSIIGSPTWNDIKVIDNSTSPGYELVRFPRSYITSLGGYRLPAEPRMVEALLVAGGGGGGSRFGEAAGGGGGGGGFVDVSPRSFSVSSILSIKIGAGGLGAYVDASGTDGSGTNGLNSSIAWGSAASESFTAIGGGAGAGGVSVDATYNGRNGGSGGGASGSNTGFVGGQAIVPTGSGFTAYGFNGGDNYGRGITTRASGGGGGAGGDGASAPSSTQSGNGGVGRQASITTGFYSGGGGGGRSASSATVLPGTGGNGGGGNGGDATNFSGATNTGGGGGGSGADTNYRGAFGGSGIIVIKYLTSARPIFTSPTSDTTTAGLTHTFVVGGSAPSPLIRSFLWQSSSDTGSTWISITIGTGLSTANYTTPILETTTSGSRFQYRVVITDTDTAGTFLIETSTGVFLTINARIVITGSYTPVKYGNSRTDTFTVQANTGTGTKTIRRTSPARTFITWDTATVNTARVTVGAQLTAGTYLDTLTVTDQESATAILVVTITVLKADTVTVTVASRNDTYTASSLSYTDTFTVIGLVAGDSLTSVSYLYSGTANDGTSFSNTARPAIAGQYVISPLYTLVNFASYEGVTVTSGTLTINRKLRTVEINTKPATLKYGDTSTVIAGTVDGASDGALSYQSNTTSLCLFSGAVLQAIEAVGNCSYTATIGRGNNFETATSTLNTTALALADTLTVTVLPITALTYTGNQAVVTPRMSVSGFKLTDTTTATSTSFSYRVTSTTDSFTATAPTLSDTYTVRADTLTVTSGLLSRYRAITYIDGILRINRAQQAPLNFAQYSAIFGSPYRIISYGGSGVGAIIGTVSAGSASGCFIDGESVTTTTEGSCLLTLIKAQDRNHETATVSALIYFLNWVVPALPAVASGPTIALSSQSAVTVDLDLAPMISSLSTYAATAGVTSITITGVGFNDADASFEVKFWRGVIGTGFIVNPAKTQITLTVPAGARSGKVIVVTSKGMATSDFSLAIAP